MRTTLNLDSELVAQVKQYALSRSLSLDRAFSELVRLGLGAPVPTRVVNGFQVVVLPANSAPVDSEHVRRLLSQD